MNSYRKLIFIIVITLIGDELVAQIVDQKRNWGIIGIVGVAQSYFDVSIPAHNFQTLEYRLGAGLFKSIGRFEIKPEVIIGLKGKRPSFLNGNVYSQPGFPMLKLDETVSGRSHLFLEIPIVVQFNFLHPKLGLRAGLSGRFWAPYNHPVDVLSSRKEVGAIGGITYRFKKFNICLDHFIGLTEIWGGSIDVNGAQTIVFEVKNRYSQIVIEYPLKK